MKKMLVADNAEMNRAILYELFGKKYEFIQTGSSEDFFKLLMHYKSDISVILVNENIAGKISPERTQTLENLKVFENTPVIIIVGREYSNARPKKINLPYSDVIYSPVNPYTVKRRVENLVELFSNKNKLEQQVKQQIKKIFEQNQALKIKQKKINEINNDMLDILSMVIEYRDVESGKHIRRIQKFTEVLLNALAKKYPKYNLTEEKIALITSASSMHDIGKIAIPDSILLSPKRLTSDEFQIMQQHTVKGCEILEQIDTVEKNDYYKYCYDICRYHHEKYDGLGYPDGLVGDAIPIWAQVVSLADCYDALTSKRPYKEAYSHEKAVDMIRDGACGAFSDEIMDCFGMVLPQFKKLAKRYADKLNPNSSSNTAVKFVNESQTDHTKDIYAKMSRDDLIKMIEHQKEVLRETHQRDCEVFYGTSDYVFEFDLVYDTIHERKGKIEDICGYIPKNYEEAVKVLAENCSDEYKSQFIRTFRLKNINQSVADRSESIVLECLMKLEKDSFSSVRCSVVPVIENGKTVKIFGSIIELHDTILNNGNGVSDKDIITGLWNLDGIKREVEDYLAYTGKNGYHMLILVDGDDFRSINRKASYHFGNRILTDIADILKKQVPESSILARIEDDNFLVFIKDCPDKDECMLMVNDIFQSIHQRYELNRETVIQTTSSIGVALYPSDGSNFETLFENASKAVEQVKVNGKNMYLFYNEHMEENAEIGYYEKTDLIEDLNDIQSLDFKKYFIPVIDSGSGRIICYDFVETSGDISADFAYIHNFPLSESSAILSLNSFKRLAEIVYSFEQENIAIPMLSFLARFKSEDCETVLNVLNEILGKYPIDCRNICIMIPQSILDNITTDKLYTFTSALKTFGFKIGVYNVGMNNFNIKCFTDNIFDKIVFAKSFLRDTADGVYPIDLAVYFTDYFYKLGVNVEIPLGVSDEFISVIKQKTNVSFGIHKEEFISLENFKEQMEISMVVIEYPILSHENTSLILSERMYDEVLEQTKSFILEWTPRFDRIKLSGSFKKIYGYTPITDDFIKGIKSSNFIHSDDINKFLEKLNLIRSDNSDSEAFIRVYSHKIKGYIWNRVKFVPFKNIAGVPVKVIVVFTEVSNESENFFDNSRTNRTDFITNLYNKRATENKIKSYLYDEGAFIDNALIIVEICGYDNLEQSLGAVFANAVVKEIAQNIQELFRDSDIIGRNSGNRFTIFVKGMSTGDKLLEKAEQVCSVINNQYQSETGDISIFGKAGISVFPKNGSTYDELYSAALNALYFAKHSIKKNTAFASDPEINNRLLNS